MIHYDKIRELTYLLMKAAVNVRNKNLSQKIDYWAVQLFEDVSLKKKRETLDDIILIKEFISLCGSIYEIEPSDQDLVLMELGNLETAIMQYGKLPDKEEASSISLNSS